MSTLIDLTGRTFGRLTVLNRHGDQLPVKWVCQCTCGEITIVFPGHLKSGATTSCGCYQKERTSERSITHGLSDTTEYEIWKGIIKRCENTSDHAYADYGGRGIRVCDRWRHSFENFYADMGPRPSLEYSIDREDNNGHYEPSNCRWATRIEQNNNRRSNRKVTYQNQEMTLSEIARLTGMPYHRLFARVHKCDMSLTTAVTKEKHEPALIEFRGRKMTLVQWAEELNVNYATLYVRIERGWSIDKAFTTPVQSNSKKKSG